MKSDLEKNLKCRNSKKCICSETFEKKYKKFAPLIEKLKNSGTKSRFHTMKKAKSCFVRFLCEAVLNVLKGSVELPQDAYEKLKPHRLLLLKVSKPSVPMRVRRATLLRKKGGFLPLLAAVIGPVLASIAGDAVGNLLFPK